MSFGKRTLSALGKIGIALSVVIVFLFGLVGTVYLSLRTSEVQVPDVTGKDRYAAEQILEGAGLKVRVRGTKASTEKPDTVLSQLPEAGAVVKAGIPVAVEISRVPKEGESVATAPDTGVQQNDNKPADNQNANQNQANNQNQGQTQNQNKPKNKNRNSNNANNKNANNSNNTNNKNANRNANGGNMNSNRNANTTPNANRTATNANRRPPANTAPANTGANKRTP